MNFTRLKGALTYICLYLTFYLYAIKRRGLLKPKDNLVLTLKTIAEIDNLSEAKIQESRVILFVATGSYHASVKLERVLLEEYVTVVRKKFFGVLVRTEKVYKIDYDDYKDKLMKRTESLIRLTIDLEKINGDKV